MLSLILAQRILSLFVIMAMGFALVRSGAVERKNIRGLSMTSLYVISPCMIITAFQVQLTDEVRSGYLLALLAGGIVQVGFAVMSRLFGRALHFDAVEQTSVEYSNCGNLIVPLVTSTLGDEWVIYCTAYLVFQDIFLWSVGRRTLSGKAGLDWRKILLSVNILAIYVGLVLLITGFRLPGPLYNAVDWVGDMIGPMAMLITGMIMGGLNFKEVFSRARLIVPVAFRLVVFPLVACLFLKFSPLAGLSPNGESVLLITLLAASAPSASTVNQMAQVYDHDAGYASSINVATTLLCIVTMPLMVAFYQL